MSNVPSIAPSAGDSSASVSLDEAFADDVVGFLSPVGSCSELDEQAPSPSTMPAIKTTSNFTVLSLTSAGFATAASAEQEPQRDAGWQGRAGNVQVVLAGEEDQAAVRHRGGGASEQVLRVEAVRAAA